MNISASTQSTAPRLRPQPIENLHATLPPPFLTKIYDLVEDPLTNSIVSWSSGNNSFIVWNLSEFSQCLLPRNFKHNNFSSFVRQLHTYGFKKVNSDCCEFAHEAFLHGQKHLLKDIHRRKSALHASHKDHPLQLELDNAMVSMLPESCVQVERLCLKQDFEQLKHDKCALEAEVVRLQQLQESLKCETLTMAKRVRIAEKRQEQMMIFLAKAIQSPAQGLTLSVEKLGVLDEMCCAGRFDLSSGDLSSFYMALLMGKAGEEQSTETSGTSPQAPSAIGPKTSVPFDAAITTRLDGTLEDSSDDLDLGVDLRDFIEEIITRAENNPPGHADMPDAFWGDFSASRN